MKEEFFVQNDILDPQSKTCRGGFTNSFKEYPKTQKPALTPRKSPLLTLIKVARLWNNCGLTKAAIKQLELI